MPIESHSKIDFRCDSTFNKLINLYGGIGTLNISWPAKMLDKSRYWQDRYSPSFEIDTLGNVIQYDNHYGTIEEIGLNTDYWDEKLTSNHLISYGKVNLKKSQLKKVEWLQFYPCLGDIRSIEDYENLKYLSIPFYYPILGFNRGYRSSRAHFSNHGTMPITATIEKLVNLEFLSISAAPIINNNYTFLKERSDLHLTDGLSAKIISLPKLKMLDLTGSTFLPVNFQDFEKFDYLRIDLQGASYPELINLAIVMNYFGKDTSSGNWTNYLNHAKVSNEFNIPETGVYNAFYKDGSPLCSGEFVNNQPNGTWKFYYSDGSLCQIREYDQGKKIGKWTFMNDLHSRHSFQVKDTSHFFTFDNDELIERIDRIFDFYPPKTSSCHDLHNLKPRDMSLLESVIRFNQRGGESKQINHSFTSVKIHLDSIDYTHYLDTLDRFQETWVINDSIWNYSFKNDFLLCPSNSAFFEFSTSGRIGEIANYSLLIEKHNGTTNSGFQYIESSSLDFGTGKINYTFRQFNSENILIKKEIRELLIENILPKTFSGLKD